jgi:protein SCO1/2
VAGAVAAGALAVGALAWATNGFTAVTTEGARRLAVQRAPVLVPSAPVRTSDDRVIDALAESGAGATRAVPRAAIVAFFYARCPGVCGRLGETLQRVQQLVRARGLEDQVRVLSLSFDATHDTPAMLARYARERRVDAALWDVRTLEPGAAREALLAAFGVVVIADGAAGYQHNAALHVVTPDRRLVQILDLDDAEGAIAAATALAPLSRIAGR